MGNTGNIKVSRSGRYDFFAGGLPAPELFPIDKIRKINQLILEDNPYGELRFAGKFFPSISAFDTVGNVLCTGTFSKIFFPGYRIGWIAASKEVISKFVLVKQGVDLQCNTMAQMDIAKFLQTYDIDEHIELMRTTYKRRCDLIVTSIDTYFPGNFQYIKPSGGLFIGITLPSDINAKVILEGMKRLGAVSHQNII